ncbi:MAG: hypothetical protein ACXABI_00745 [Candidatus Hodarchaeales archaeon]|jgi:DNA-binding MarR family transcriptional regulator
MRFRRIHRSFLNLRIPYQVLLSTISLLVVGYLVGDFLIQFLTISSKSDKSQPQLEEFLTIIFVIMLLVIITIMNTFLVAKFYRSRYPKGHTSEIFLSTETDFLQGIRNKVVVGLENIRSELHESYPVKDLPSISTSSTMLDHFPSDMRDEISSKIKGKTIFTLIEIAYQDPKNTNPSNISKSLNIPPSSLSREIKKLISLKYLETYVSDIVIQDARIRNFKITPKGFYFLSQLNDALKMTINRLKMRETEIHSF